MEKIKEKLHIGSKHKESKEESGMTSVEHDMEQKHAHAHDYDDHHHSRESYDADLDGMTPDERVRYLKDLDYAEKNGEPKKGSFLEKLIAKGNKKTEDDLAAEHAARAKMTVPPGQHVAMR